MPVKKQFVITQYDYLDDLFDCLDMCSQEDFLDDTEIGYDEDGTGHLNLYYPSGEYALNTGDEGCSIVELLKCGCCDSDLKVLFDKWDIKEGEDERHWHRRLYIG